MFSIGRKIYFYIGEMEKYISKPKFLYKEFLMRVFMKKGIKRDYSLELGLISLSCSSNKPGFINRNINNNINRGLDGNCLKGGYKK